MISVLCVGRLGNLLFQYAVGRHLAIKHNTTLTLNFNGYLNRANLHALAAVKQLKHLNINANFYYPVARRLLQNFLDDRVSPDAHPIYFEKHFGFDANVLLQPDGICLNGFFQSEKYFKAIKQIIKADLELKNSPPHDEVLKVEDRILSTNSVAMTFRRGDYIGNPLHEVCTMQYYTRAVKYIGERSHSPHFFIFSDDISWCRRHVNIPNGEFVDLRNCKTNVVQQLRLMSLCKHNIIANSTFPWWGAWLNTNSNRITIAPNKWFNHEAMNKLALKDTIPEDWIRIDV